ncbi:MRG-domain-containing protein [Chlamydoabsidia padenii]|nr:MRG-domain-containing protein [Chlamydoabsidia padenii]
MKRHSIHPSSSLVNSFTTMADSTLYKYNQDDKVLCYHGPLIYEAKILDRKTEIDSNNEAKPLYKIHYQGWNKKWNEWVNDSRILNWNSANLDLQKQVKALYLNEAKSKKHPTNKTTPMKRKREVRTEKIEENDDNFKLPELLLDIPQALKCQLVDDWENITLHQQLVPLPRNPTITQIMAQYKEHKMNKRNGDKHLNPDLLDQVLHGLCMYFDKSLGPVLLYRFERRQYHDILKNISNKKDLTDIYGAEHLLRLFVQLPKLIGQTDMDKDTISVLNDYLVDIVQYILNKRKQLFVPEYQNAPPAYISLVNRI